MHVPSPKPPDIKAYALRLLARREHSRLELKRKLLSKQFPADLIDSTLAMLSEKGWQDDQRFAEMYVRARIERGDGLLKLQMKLRECGLSEALMAQTLPTDDAFWREHIQRKWGKKCDLSTKDFARRAKDIRFLQSRGFTLEQIRAATHADIF
jgi:regulatory protein